MEQKQLDDMEDSFFGDEFIEEDVKIESMSGLANEMPKNSKKSIAKNAKDNKRAAKKIAPIEKSEVKVVKEEIKDQDKKEKSEDVKISSVNDEPKVEESKVEESKAKTVPTVDPWEEEGINENSSKGGAWKVIAGILLILLVASVYTSGFGLTGSATVSELSMGDAEQKALDYVNTNLLQEPFFAEISSSEDAGSLYQVTLLVAGQEVQSYITKDGSLFFPQGFPVNEELTLEAQDGPVMEVSIDDDAIKGDINAPVTIVEFSDFECPFCGKYSDESYSLIVENYVNTGKVKYVFRDFPLSFHPNAQKAAEAAECAGEQGRFWDMHDYLFENQDYLAVENLKGYAKDLDLDTEEFNDCLDSGRMAEEVENDLLEGQSYGVSGTPGFFINGKLISGAQPYSVFEQEIEAALAAVGVVESETEMEVEVEVQENNEVELEDVLVEEVNEEPTPVVIEDLVEPVQVEKVQTGTVKEFSINAKKWLFNPNKLVAKKGDLVKLSVVPSGLDFTFELPAYNVKQEIKGNTVIEFVADKTGAFEFKCGSCEAWRGMAGNSVIE